MAERWCCWCWWWQRVSEREKKRRYKREKRGERESWVKLPKYTCHIRGVHGGCSWESSMNH